MGLYIHNLSPIPMDLDRSYYLYVLDYGWDEPLGKTIRENFSRMADLAARNEAIVLAGTNPREFANEIFSAHVDDYQFSYSDINGERGDEILPALMISNIHPRRFKERFPNYRFHREKKGAADEKLILIPLRGVCNSSTEVVALIERIFRDIAEKKPLLDFTIAKEIKAGNGNAVSDAIILKPSLWGIGVDIRELIKAWKK
ncbi:MAG: hypothetical protein V9G98_01740 [Candidatus Competibacter sp.]